VRQEHSAVVDALRVVLQTPLLLVALNVNLSDQKSVTEVIRMSAVRVDNHLRVTVPAILVRAWEPLHLDLGDSVYEVGRRTLGCDIGEIIIDYASRTTVRVLVGSTHTRTASIPLVTVRPMDVPVLALQKRRSLESDTIPLRHGNHVSFVVLLRLGKVLNSRVVTHTVEYALDHRIGKVHTLTESHLHVD
jgi:hypothetical protein